MTYDPKTWKNKPDHSSPINAAGLNHMEQGIAEADANATSAKTEVEDVRIGADGTVYASAGEAVREQNSKLSNSIDDIGIKSDNMFNKATITPNKVQPINANYLIDNNNYDTSDFIAVESGKTYSATSTQFSAYYNSSNRNVGTPSPNTTFTVPDGVVKLRVSMRHEDVNSFMFNEGDTLESYKEYGKYYLNEDAITSQFSKHIIEDIKSGDDNFIIGRNTNNMFNKNNITPGKYQPPNVSYLVTVAGWNASDFVALEVGETYSAPYLNFSCLFNNGSRVATPITGNTFVCPAGVTHIRFSIKDADLDSFMFCKGNELLPHEVYRPQIVKECVPNEVVEYIGGQIIPEKKYENIVVKELNNPFVKTKIKLLGDSITAGVGGTGYSPTGETMKGGQKANVLTAVSWANMFYHYVEQRFNNKNFKVPFTDSRIIKKAISSTIKRFRWNVTIESFTTVMDSWGIEDSNVNAGVVFAAFDFYGTNFSLSVLKGDFGKFEVYVDGELSKTIDCYSENEIYDVIESITGLTEDNHNVLLKTTADKNASATNLKFDVLYLVIPKTAIVKPWGLSGESSLASSFRMEEDDDIVILQYGTNDRHSTVSAEVTEKNLLDSVEKAFNTYHSIPILMVANPTSPEEITRYPRQFQMWDIHDVIELLAEKLGLQFVDNYTAFIDYIENHDTTIDTLLADGLHPNDLGYKVMYENIMKTLGLSLIITEDEQNE